MRCSSGAITAKRERLTVLIRVLSCMQMETDLGRIVVRPMHRQHIFETALLATEAFLVDRNPPEFQWMM